MTLLIPPDEPVGIFALACARYSLLRALYAAPGTAQTIAQAKAVTVSAVSQQLPSLFDAGLIVQRPGTAPAEWELTPSGRDVFQLVSGLIPPSGARLGWIVTCRLEDASPADVRDSFVELAGEDATFSSAGDADYIAFLPNNAHDLVLELNARLRTLGADPMRALALPD